MVEEEPGGIPLEKALERIQKSAKPIEEKKGIEPRVGLVDRIKGNMGYILGGVSIATIVATIGATIIIGASTLYLIRQYQKNLEARVSQPTPTAPHVIESPEPSPVIDYQIVSLQDAGYWRPINLGLEGGNYLLLDKPFETGWQVDTQCGYNSSSPTVIPLDINIPQPRNVHLLIQAGWGIQQYADKEFGSVLLGFQDGSYIQLPLVLGDNIRDWTRNRAGAVSTAYSPYLQEAWRGPSPYEGVIGGMDVLTIEIPDEYQNSALRSIQIYDTSSETVGSVDPCIHLSAVTVEYVH